ITDLAREYFELPQEIKVTTYDGRAFLAACDKKYDVIMVDAYQDITIPFQMSSVEFFTLVKEHLNEGGVMVVNMNMRSESSDGINNCLADTISSVFGNVVTIDVAHSTNRELFASDSDSFLDRLSANTDALPQEDLRNMMRIVKTGLEPYKAGDHILTDDKAPVELLGMKVIDDIIQDELVYYKQAFKEKGIKGLLE
ncbi:fused MFS/spermidine synthase, partial [Ruminococcus sp.]